MHLLFGAQAFDDLIDDGGGVLGMAVEAEEICGDGWLAAFNLALCFLEVGFKSWPGFFIFRFAIPLSDVA